MPRKTSATRRRRAGSGPGAPGEPENSPKKTQAAPQKKRSSGARRRARWRPRGEKPKYPGRYARAQRTRRRLLDAARRIVAADGLWALTLERLGTDCGCNKSLISFHFGSKTGLLAETLQEDGATAAALVEERWRRRRRRQTVSDLIDITRKLLSETLVAEAVRWSCTADEDERETLSIVAEPILAALARCLEDADGARGVDARGRQSLAMMVLVLAVFAENLPPLRGRGLLSWLGRVSRET